MPIRLTTLGAARAHIGETDLTDLPAQRLRFALLLYLAVEKDVAREEVVAMFWPDRDTARGKHALRQMLYELRQVLGEDWVEMRRDRIVVSATVDAAEFENALEDGRPADALAFYGGPFLHGFALENRSFEAWADRRRGHLARLHRRLQRDHIAALAASGRADDALDAARHWVELDPLDDEAAHTLIERLAAAGQRTAALQYYENYVRQLEAELEVEPLEETQALVASIRNGEVVATVDPPIDAAAPLAVDLPAGLPSPDHATPRPQASHPARSSVADGPGARMPVRRRPREIWRAASLARRSLAVATLVVLVGVISYVAQRSAAADAVPEDRIIVAMTPITDHSADGSLQPLAESLTDDLTRAIARSGQLGVRSANAVRELRDRGVAENEIGTKLGATYMVGGGVSLSGDLVRAVIELLDGDGMVLQSRTIERPFAESRYLNQDIGRIAEEFLSSELRVPVHVRFERSGASSEQAFRLVGATREMQNVVVSMVEAGQLESALARLADVDSMLALAARLDPQWAEPLVLRGWNLERRAFVAALTGNTALRRELLERALAFADQADRLGPDNAEAHALRGTVLSLLAGITARSAPSLTHAYDSAEAELKRATQLDPSNHAAWRRLSEIQLNTGRYGEALYSAREGLKLAGPQSQGFLYQAWAAGFEIGNDLEADGWCMQLWTQQKSLPGLYCLLALQAWGTAPADPAAARRAMDYIQKSDLRLQPEIGPRFQTLLAGVYARAGQADSARAILGRVSGGDPGVLWLRAGVEALLGDDAAAVALLERYLDADPLHGARIVRSRPFWDLGVRVDLEELIARGTRLAKGPGTSGGTPH